MSEDINVVIRDYLVGEFLSDGDQIDDTTQLIEEEILDSIGIFSAVSFIEERFGIEIPPEDVVLDNFETVPAIAQLVRRELGSSG